MDIGMYGHTQHNGPYDPNYYTGNYSPPGDQNYGSGVQTHISQPHQGYGHPPGYDEPYPSYGEGSDTSCSNQDNIHYYHQQETSPIISTEGGLSYTNLDYGQQYGYVQSHHDFHGLHRHDNNQINHQQPYIPCEQPNESVYVPPLVGHGACMEYSSHHRYKEEVMNPGEGDCTQQQRIQQHRQHYMQHPQQQPPAVPTYKWMQVKRNVPKPNGKFFFLYLLQWRAN